MASDSTTRKILIYVGVCIALIIVIIAVVGWLLFSGYQRFDEAKRKFEAVARMRWLAIAVRDYHAEHDAYPDSLQELKPLFGQGKGSTQLQFSFDTLAGKVGLSTFEQVLENPWTGDNPGFEYVKPAQPRNSTPILYQLRNGQRADGEKIGYFDASIK